MHFACHYDKSSIHAYFNAHSMGKLHTLRCLRLENLKEHKASKCGKKISQYIGKLKKKQKQPLKTSLNLNALSNGGKWEVYLAYVPISNQIWFTNFPRED